MTDDRHYDVIIIGTGAGGGTLAHRLAPTGKQVLLLERGGYLPRERDNWDSTAVFVKGKYRAPEFWYRRRRRRVPAGGQLLRRRQHQVLRRRAVPAAPARTSASYATTAASPRRGRSSYEDLEPYYTQAEHLYLVHGQPRRGPHRGAGQRAVRATRRCSTSHGSNSSATTWRSRACTRSTCRSG